MRFCHVLDGPFVHNIDLYMNTLKNYHQKLFPYAYNILGSYEDAKDAVQDILVKYLSMQKDHIANETGYLIRSVVNHSINLKKRKNKTISNQVWLPEPIDTADDRMDHETILSYSLLVLLEKLTPKERAVFILKEAYDYSHKETAEAIDSSIENSRKLLSRAKTKLKGHTLKNERKQPEHGTYLAEYMHAIQNGDTTSLEQLLSNDILLAADGGENIKVVREITTGIRATSKLLLYVYKAFLSGLTFKIGQVNHQPAILYYQNKVLYNCQVFELDGHKIRSIYSIVDPEKLKSLSK